MDDVLMVVVSYNNANLTVDCLNALMRQKDVSLNVVLWDNSQNQDTIREVTAQVPKEMLNNSLTIVDSEENLLWTPAINRAVRQFYSGEKFIGFMNNDILLHEDTVARMVKGLHEHINGGIIAPMGSALGGPQDWASANGEWPIGVTNLDQMNDFLKDRPVKRVTYVVGACCLVPAYVWKEVGELDPSMPLGADDHDYCMRLKDAGYHILVSQNIYANHTGHASGGSSGWNEWGGKSWEVFNQKWAGYYATEEEAIKCHWGGDYVPGWDGGTGWDE